MCPQGFCRKGSSAVEVALQEFSWQYISIVCPVTDGELEFRGRGTAAIHPGTDCLPAAAGWELSADKRQNPLLLEICSSSTFRMRSVVRMVEQGFIYPITWWVG